ncbi:MAG TPA: DNA polymerase I [Terriglobales bacterium]|nr:DNA polymerase I [Terriglobales bacterium]
MSAKPQPEARPHIFLIDAMSFIFRAYHAMQRQRPMSTRTGVPTAATFVFVNMLNKLRDDFHPQYLAAVFDVAAPTFRDEQAKAIASVKKFDSKTQTYQEVAYGGYKANRKEMPHDLAQQLPYIRRALEAYRIPILEQPGFEADDVIGTLAHKANTSGYPVYVVSSDKDMLQLVGHGICVLNPTKDNLICDAAKVEEILGVPPSQVIDVMALRGDSIDNIPGAPGIGDKGSVELIKRFGSVENALDRAEEVERKTYRESLLNNRDVVLRSKDLVTIDTNVPVHLNLETMRAQDPDYEACRVLFNELEFTTLLKDFLQTTDQANVEYGELKSEQQLEKLLKQVKQGEIGLAVCAPSASPAGAEEKDDEPELPLLNMKSAAADDPVEISIAVQENKALTFRLGDTALSAKVESVLADESIPKSVHDYKSALRLLWNFLAVPQEVDIVLCLPLAGVRNDVMLFSYLLNPTYSSHTLAEVALRRFNLQLSGMTAEAADVTLRLARALRTEVEGEAGLINVYDTIDLPLAPVLARMESAGVKIDSDALARMSVELEKQCDARSKEIHALAGEEFNVNSPRQLGEVLFNKLGLPKPVKYGKGKTISTAVDVLEELAVEHEIARKVLEFRQLSKLKSTYVDSLPTLVDQRTGRVHTTFNPAGTATGRLSSTNPNLQNIPIRTEVGREIRSAFIAEPGNVLLSADYSQIELRLLAHFSDDPLLVEAYRREDDIHQLTASEVFGIPPMLITAEHRGRAKAVNFGIVYGISPFGLAAQLGIDQKEAKKYIETYFERYKGVRAYIDRVLDETRREQRVRTLFGRIRPIPDINSKNANMRGFAERTAVNTPLQGTAADVIKLAMIKIDAELTRRKLRSRMTLQVHDELVFEVPEKEIDIMRELVREHMQNVYPFKVPLMVDIGVGHNWRDLD